MIKLSYLSPRVAIAGAMEAADFAAVAGLGFRTIINNRPDAEEPGQLTARTEAVYAWRAGVAYRHIPAAKHEVLDDHVLDPLAGALASAQGPVLLHCRSGQRSTIMWAVLQVEAGAPVGEVIEKAKLAGIDLSVLRDEIAERGAARAVLERPTKPELVAA